MSRQHGYRSRAAARRRKGKRVTLPVEISFLSWSPEIQFFHSPNELIGRMQKFHISLRQQVNFSRVSAIFLLLSPYNNHMADDENNGYMIGRDWLLLGAWSHLTIPEASFAVCFGSISLYQVSNQGKLGFQLLWAWTFDSVLVESEKAEQILQLSRLEPLMGLIHAGGWLFPGTRRYKIISMNPNINKTTRRKQLGLNALTIP